MRDRTSLLRSLREHQIDTFPRELRPDQEAAPPASAHLRETYFASDEIFVHAGPDPAGPDVLAQLADEGWTIEDAEALRRSRVARLRSIGEGDVCGVLDGLYTRDVAASPNHIFAVPANDLSGQPHYQSAPQPVPAAGEEVRWSAPDRLGSGLVRVTVLDTGLTEHKWLSDESAWLDSERDDVDVDDDGNRDPAAGHGTFVAGILARMAPHARVRVLDVLDGAGWVSELHLAQRVEELPAADILNLSCGGFTYRNRPPLLLKRAIEGWLDRNPGSVVVAAAGNAGVSRRFWPAALRRVISVAAVDADHAPASFSNYGTDDDPWVDACAPAVDVTSTFITFPQQPEDGAASAEARFDGWARWSGTSFAVPVVVAAIARRMEASGTTITAERAWRDLCTSAPVVQRDGKHLGVLLR